jgi:hypothetical protein
VLSNRAIWESRDLRMSSLRRITHSRAISDDSLLRLGVKPSLTRKRVFVSVSATAEPFTTMNRLSRLETLLEVESAIDSETTT